MPHGLTEKFFVGLDQGVEGDHGAHSGLGDDDHSQYLLASGTRAMAGDLDMGGFDILDVGAIHDDSVKRLDFNVPSPGDISVYKDDGTTISLIWNESTDRWEFKTNVDFGSSFLTGVQLISSLDTDLNIRALNSGAAGSVIRMQTDDSGGTLRNRLLLIGTSGDVEFYKDDGVTLSLQWDESEDRWEFTTPVVIDQLSTTGAAPVLTLDQADVDEDFFKFIGTSDTNVDRALVDAVNFTTPGAIVGWLKVNVQDDQGTDPIVDGDYYVPFYAAPTA